MQRFKTSAVIISPKAKRITLQRFLLSKFVFEKEECTLRDLCCLFENQLWLEQKCHNDPEFQKKFGKSLEVLSFILKEINFRMRFSDRTLNRFSRRIKKELEEMYLPKRNYLGVKKTQNGLFQLTDPRPQGIKTKLLRPKARIGKGYSDKGSAKDRAKDGSPSWQEVSVHRGSLYHKGEYLNDKTETSSADERLENLRRFCFGILK